jgi:hypothetical protein
MGPIADLLNPQWSDVQLTNEVWTMDDYSLPQAWAMSFFASGYSGLSHGLRHYPDTGARGVSVFGPRGAQPDDPRFTSSIPDDMNQATRDEFSALTSIKVEGSPVPRLSLHVIR